MKPSLALSLGRRRKYSLNPAAMAAGRAAELGDAGDEIDGELLAAHHVLLFRQNDVSGQGRDARADFVDAGIAGRRAGVRRVDDDAAVGERLLGMAVDHQDAHRVCAHTHVALDDDDVARIGAVDDAAARLRRRLLGGEVVGRDVDRRARIVMGRGLGKRRRHSKDQAEGEDRLHLGWDLGGLMIMWTWPCSWIWPVFLSTSKLSARKVPIGPCPVTATGPWNSPFFRSTFERSV